MIRFVCRLEVAAVNVRVSAELDGGEDYMGRYECRVWTGLMTSEIFVKDIVFRIQS